MEVGLQDPTNKNIQCLVKCAFLINNYILILKISFTIYWKFKFKYVYCILSDNPAGKLQNQYLQLQKM